METVEVVIRINKNTFDAINELSKFVDGYDSFYTTYPLGWWLKPYKAESSETKRGLAYADQETMMPAT